MYDFDYNKLKELEKSRYDSIIKSALSSVYGANYKATVMISAAFDCRIHYLNLHIQRYGDELKQIANKLYAELDIRLKPDYEKITELNADLKQSVTKYYDLCHMALDVERNMEGDISKMISRISALKKSISWTNNYIEQERRKVQIKIEEISESDIEPVIKLKELFAERDAIVLEKNKALDKYREYLEFCFEVDSSKVIHDYSISELERLSSNMTNEDDAFLINITSNNYKGKTYYLKKVRWSNLSMKEAQESIQNNVVQKSYNSISDILDSVEPYMRDACAMNYSRELEEKILYGKGFIGSTKIC